MFSCVRRNTHACIFVRIWYARSCVRTYARAYARHARYARTGKKFSLPENLRIFFIYIKFLFSHAPRVFFVPPGIGIIVEKDGFYRPLDNVRVLTMLPVHPVFPVYQHPQCPECSQCTPPLPRNFYTPVGVCIDLSNAWFLAQITISGFHLIRLFSNIWICTP